MKRSTVWKLSAAAAVSALLLSLVTALSLNGHPAGAAPTGSQPIPGHLVPRLRSEHPTGNTSGTQTLNLSIALSLRNRAGLTALVAAQSNPHSPEFHHYLTPGQFKAQYGPTQANVNAISGYLRDHGLVVGTISPNNTLIHASGTVAAIESAFGVTLANYSLDGRVVHAPTNEPTLPANLAAMVTSISGLDNVGVYRPLGLPASSRPAIGSGPGGTYTPGDLRTAYDMNTLISTSNGAGQTVAIFELDGYNSSDVNTYLNTYALGAPKYSNVVVDGASTTPGSGAVEVELDMDVVSAIAPGATQRIYIGPNTFQGVLDTYNQIVLDNIAKVTTTSWGLCEANAGTSFLQSLDNVFAQGAVQGQAVFAAAGDAGAYDCGTTSLGVDNPADDPNVIGVGGTSLQTGTGGTYSSESVWSNTADTSRGPMGAGGGGGLSTYFARPSYQTGPGTTNSYSNGEREVPDVSADADPSIGYAMYCSVVAAGCSTAGWYRVGGTSAAAPLWAGLATDLNQYLAANSRPVLGEGHATLYQLFNTTQSQAAFHDITSGNNLYYPTTAGYDLASGIGTPDVWNMALDLNSAPTPTPTPLPPTPTPAPGSGTINNGGFETGTFTGWTTSGAATSISSTSHSGLFAAQLGSTSPTSGDSSISQSFSITGGVSTLSFWYKVVCPDTVTFDWAKATLTDTTTNTTSTPLAKTCSNTGAWNEASATVVGGHSYTLTLTSHDDNYASDPTYTLFDDVVLSSQVTNPVANSGFEAGNLTGWTTAGAATSISTTGHSGSFSGQAGSTSPTNGDSTLSQTFTAPAGSSGIGLWYRVVCPDTVTYDWATITLKDNTANTTATLLGKTCSNTGTWSQVSASIVAGHSYTLTLLSHDDNFTGDATYTLFDDVAVI